MYGFKPQHARGKPVQNFADGGIVHSITGMLGMRKRTPEEMLAADAKVQERNREAAARVAARAKPAQQAAPAEEKAVSSYAGMSAMQRREKELGLKDGGIVGGFKPGGLIRGPGTGTSDSIETEKRPGTFIMPADSTQAIGPEALQSLGAPKGMPEAEGMEEPGDMDDRDEPEGEKVPVRLSNGEFELPPEQVQALGEAVLTVMRNATHQPAGEQGEAPTGKGFTPHQFFSGGGTVQDEERLKRINQIPAGSDVPVPAPIGTQPGRTPEPAAQPAAPVPTAASTQSAGQPLDAQAASDRAKLGAAWDTVKDVNDSAGRAIADVAMLAPRAVAGAYDSAVVRPMRAAGFNAGYLSPILVPNGVDPSSMTPYTDQKRMQEQAGAVAPSAPAATSSVAATASTAGAGRGSVNPPLANPSAPAPSAQPAAQTGSEIMPGVFKHGRGQYSDQSTGMGMPAGFTGQPSAQNMAAADALAARQTPAGFQPAGSQPAGVQAPVVRNSTNDWAARNNLRNLEVGASSITNQPGFSRGGRGYVPPDVAAYQAALQTDAALQQAQPGMDKAAMDSNTALQREGIQQAGATARDAGRTALAGEELGLKRTAAGFQTRALQRVENLRNTLIDPKATPEQRKQAQEHLQALAVSDKEPSPQYKSYVMPAIRNADGSTTEGGVYQENTRTGEGRWVKPQGGGNSNGGQQQNFENKQIYKDANGNERRYNNGVWEKV